jgi:hypothetical protein
MIPKVVSLLVQNMYKLHECQGRPRPCAGWSIEPGLQFFGAQLWNFWGQIFKTRSIKYFNMQLLTIQFQWSSGCCYLV